MEHQGLSGEDQVRRPETGGCRLAV